MAITRLAGVLTGPYDGRMKLAHLILSTILAASSVACAQPVEAPTLEARVECLTAYVECRHRADPITREHEGQCWGEYLDCAAIAAAP